ncbi:DUF928 domain-containing protein [Microcoleus sp. FACHB-1515]|uniref:DUF928 domain-containing protein n=1 Tax=Cyanophyceae TaxID=3028117 RepID=UPI0016854503|nr:DUF928 domain-containing protein [Microcoleus sp. FACHB-1515]MBD2090930.1 DUF928 domain-containing protein [Microcoleus sp. FACHB-1515]
MQHTSTPNSSDHKRPPIKPIALGLAIALAASFSWESIALAQEYVPPPNVGIPGRRRAAGTRAPSCVTGDIPLTALQPENSYGLKIGESPTWFWYKPETSVTTAEFSLLDAAGNPVYETTLSLPAEAQIVSFTLPEAVSIAADAEYQWYFSIVCNPDDRAQDIFTEGWIRSVALSPALLEELASDTDEVSPESAAANGFWYDALFAIAAQRRQPSPFDSSAETAWRSLLESVDLGDLADVPLSETDLSVPPAQP